jgi:Fe-S cluster biogenesis protein NfuA
MNGKKEFQQRLQKIEELISEIESTADPKLRSSTIELMQSMMEMHGTAIERMLSIVFESDPGGEAIIDKLAHDETTESLLLLYGLHPFDLETRVIRALEKVRPEIQSHKADFELLSIDEGTVRLRLEGGGGGCGSSAATLKTTIQEAVYDSAPDITALEIEEAPKPLVLVQLERNGKRSDKKPLIVVEDAAVGAQVG